MNTKYVSLTEISDRLGLPLAFLRREVQSGRLPFVNAGSRRMFDEQAVRTALAAQAAKGVKHGQ
jgi:excisionase family DNA binding protein